MTLGLGIPSDFLNDRTKLWRAFLDAGKSTFHLEVNEQTCVENAEQPVSFSYL